MICIGKVYGQGHRRDDGVLVEYGYAVVVDYVAGRVLHQVGYEVAVDVLVNGQGTSAEVVVKAF